jgi:hypothetical protein
VTDFFRDRPPEAGTESLRPANAPRRSPAWAGKLIALAAAAVLLSGGLIIWRLAGGQPARLAAGQPARQGATAPAGHGAASTAAPARASPTRTAPRQGRGNNAVALPAALARTPAAQHVAAFLQTYFRVINQRDYTGYASLLAPSLRPTAQQFQAGYRSTKDSGAVLTSLSASSHGLAATVTFISHQDPALSPDHSRCTTWEITLYLRPFNGSYLIVPPPHGYRAAHEACV